MQVECLDKSGKNYICLFCEICFAKNECAFEIYIYMAQLFKQKFYLAYVCTIVMLKCNWHCSESFFYRVRHV